jgi:hypothetical protein
MRKYFLTTAAVMAIATPALAADPSGGLSGGYVGPGDPVLSSAPMVVGDLELSIGRTNWEIECPGECELSWNQFNGWARANVPVGGTWNILVEAGGNAVFGGDYPDGISLATFSSNAHVWSNTNGTRYGAFGGASFGVNGPAGNDTWGAVGLEAETDIGNATVGAQGFYSWFTGDCGGDCDLYGVNGWADYYFRPNTKATGTLSWARGFGGDVDIFGVRGRATHRLAGTAINVFGEAGYSSADWSEPRVNVANASVGLTINLDGPGYTQQEHDGQVPFTFRNPIISAKPMFWRYGGI